MPKSVREIEHFEMLIHPDFTYLKSDEKNPERGAPLRRLWTDKVLDLVPRVDTAYLYFPAINPYNRAVPEKILQLEGARRTAYEALLGERFICFEIESEPRWRLLRELKERGFRHSENTTIDAYGVYEEWCVAAWLDMATETLELPARQTRKVPGLSVVRCRYDIDI